MVNKLKENFIDGMMQKHLFILGFISCNTFNLGMTSNPLAIASIKGKQIITKKPH